MILGFLRIGSAAYRRKQNGFLKKPDVDTGLPIEVCTPENSKSAGCDCDFVRTLPPAMLPRRQ